jgi:catechol 2,3-dioxygenase-like lactoylglutathione lyase family enzyme
VYVFYQEPTAMKCTQFHPVLISNRVADTARFYTEHLRFKTLFDSGWYVHLQSIEDASVNLGIVETGHATIPKLNGGPVGGLLLNFEVSDVDAEYERALAQRLPILLSLRDEAWGQRHFITHDPNGVLIDVIKPIPPTAEFLASYAGAPANRAG